MLQIALSAEFQKRWGAQILNVAPAQLELVVLDDAAQNSWRTSEILINSEFANGASLESLITHMPNLRWLHTIYAGTDDIPWELVTARRLIVTNSAGVYAPMMAEYVIAMVILMYRNLPAHLLAQRQHRWEPSRAHDLSNQELYGKHMGIIGYGATGRRLAETANAFGMRVWAMRRTPTLICNEPVERLLDADGLDELLHESDIVVITASLNSGTRGLLGLNEFKQMKSNAVLVNIARGAIVDETALVHALRQGWLRGAILDVTTIEPLPPESPLWDAPNTLITPHISGEMPVGRERSMELFCKNLALYLGGSAAHFANRVRAASHS